MKIKNFVNKNLTKIINKDINIVNEVDITKLLKIVI